MIEQEKIASGCGWAGFGWMLEKLSSVKGWSSIEKVSDRVTVPGGI